MFKFRNYGTFFIILITFVMIFNFSASSQELKELDPKGSDKLDENFNKGEEPDNSYLAKFHAQDVVAKLIKQNLDQIYLLNVIVKNFDKGWGDEYQKIYEEYKRAIELYYKRDMVFARVWFERNQKSISDLMKKMADSYKERTQEILNDCHAQIVSLHLNQKVRSDPNKYKELIQNQMRLQIAYGQMDDAQNEYTARNYEQSLYHFRIAKAYGIRILETVAYADESDPGAKDKDEKLVLKIKDVKEKYKKDKADNRNRIYEDIKPKSDQKSSETPPK